LNAGAERPPTWHSSAPTKALVPKGTIGYLRQRKVYHCGAEEDDDGKKTKQL
jgi:hypothetical protein